MSEIETENKLLHCDHWRADAMDEPQLDHEDVLAIARLAGLRLPAAYESELVDAYSHVRRLVALVPRPRSRGDEPAHAFDPTGVAPPPR